MNNKKSYLKQRYDAYLKLGKAMESGEFNIPNTYDSQPLYSQKHPFWSGKPWYLKLLKWIIGFFIRPKFTKENIE